ncbi:FecR family protein [Sphingobacterium sp. SGR-19]|uniref:FecR family protein n=1 Tax=Sphingobacterium sp. SGR-19 TaxID=2710886 RepID=UPI0013ED5750|nr:FecR family protein [Sphingobacterium sp. SGR-19]NGM66705.1 DUF4974 domain-containing protein [Sphingobacterium sp. SGR-19]
MDKTDIKELFARYKAGHCTDEEIQLLHKWLMDGQFESSDIPEEAILEDLKQLEASLPLKQPQKTYSLRHIIGYAASLLFIFGLGYYVYTAFLSSNENLEQHSEIALLAPGSNKALLKLADGSSIPLDIAERDSIMHIDGSTVQLNSTGQLVYLSEEEEIIKNHEVITPMGGQYEVILPDGTHVWLNSSSQLRFTNTFKTLPERRVELEGEAYFKVSRNVSQPFIVTVRGQEIKVLGTEFNVNAYQENHYVKASLVEGSVLFNQKQLKPGQSAIYGNNKTLIRDENMDDIVAWKNGYFVFFEEPLEEAMKKVSRWYDLDVSFTDQETKSILFGGSISKYENAREVFKMIEKAASNVKIDVQGRTVTITKIQTNK